MSEKLTPTAKEVMADLEGKMIIIDLLKSAQSQNPYLHDMEQGRFSQQEWQHWGIERYNAAAGFLEFLRAVKDKAGATGLNNVARAVQDNIRDEEGYPLTGSHEDWRQDFLGFLEVTPGMVKAAPRTMMEDKYRQIREYMLAKESPWVAVGALVHMENSIAEEMKRVKKGLDNSPWAQDKLASMSEQDQRRAQLYVVHHAQHDEDHFSDLTDACLKDLEAMPKDQLMAARSDMHEGMLRIMQGRWAIYAGLQVQREGHHDMVAAKN